MLPRSQRLRQRRDIGAVVRHGRITAARPFLVHALRTPGRPTRFAIIVSRQTEKRSVRRNQVKRRLRAVLAALRASVAPETAVLLRVRPAARSLSTAQLDHEVRRAFQRARLLP